MNRPGDDTDRLIREALEQEDVKFAADAGDASMIELLVATFRGRHRWLATGAATANLVLLVAGILSGLRFLRSDDQREMLIWGAAALFCFGAVTAIKIWYWLEMYRLAITREIKRVELRVIQLARRIEQSKGI